MCATIVRGTAAVRGEGGCPRAGRPTRSGGSYVEPASGCPMAPFSARGAFSDTCGRCDRPMSPQVLWAEARARGAFVAFVGGKTRAVASRAFA